MKTDGPRYKCKRCGSYSIERFSNNIYQGYRCTACHREMRTRGTDAPQDQVTYKSRGGEVLV